VLTATVSQVKNGLSAYLRRVKAGETVRIVERKTPVARIVPLTDQTSTSPMSSQSDRARIEQLVAEGVAVRGRDEGALGALRQLGGSWPAGHGLLGALLDERESEYQGGHR